MKTNRQYRKGNTKYELTFEDNVNGKENLILVVEWEPSDEFLKQFLQEQYYTSVRIKKIVEEVAYVSY